MATYVTAHSVEEATAAMAAGARPVAGGTDLVVASRQGKSPLPDRLVGIHRIPGLGTIEERQGEVIIGSLVSHAGLVASRVIRSTYTALADAAAVVGSHATRSNGTLGGNVMNASPAMDTGAPLLCLDASATLVGPSGSRSVDIADLWTGPGATIARPDELLTEITLPTPEPGTGSSYIRLQYRRQMDIAVVGVGAVITLVDGTISASRVAITSVAPTIRRVPASEAALVGTTGDEHSIQEAAEAAAEASTPIDDVRASADYRTAMVKVMTTRAVRAAIIRASGGEVPIPASDSTFGS